MITQDPSEVLWELERDSRGAHHARAIRMFDRRSSSTQHRSGRERPRLRRPGDRARSSDATLARSGRRARISSSVEPPRASRVDRLARRFEQTNASGRCAEELPRAHAGRGRRSTSSCARTCSSTLEAHRGGGREGRWPRPCVPAAHLGLQVPAHPRGCSGDLDRAFGHHAPLHARSSWSAMVPRRAAQARSCWTSTSFNLLGRRAGWVPFGQPRRTPSIGSGSLRVSELLAVPWQRLDRRVRAPSSAQPDRHRTASSGRS